MIPEPPTHTSSEGEQSSDFPPNQEILANETISTQLQPTGEQLIHPTSSSYITDIQLYESDDFTDSEPQFTDSASSLMTINIQGAFDAVLPNRQLW